MSSSEDEEVILLINKNIEHGHGSIFRVHKNLINVIILGLSLMLIFTAFQTCSMIEVCIICYKIRNDNIFFSITFKQYLIYYLYYDAQTLKLPYFI